MIDACRGRFLGRLSPERFQLRDMRALDGYPRDSFDFVLNSYNTIDHLDPRERAVFLAQARRIVSPGGYLCFSAHNIRSLATYPAIEWSWRRPHATLRALVHRRRYLRLNRRALDTYAQADYVIINNGTHDDFALELLYVRPEAQLDALRLAGFAHVTVFSLDTGGVIGENAIASANDRWLYYLCS
jgi:SAM-dependent methyltransferase